MEIRLNHQVLNCPRGMAETRLHRALCSLAGFWGLDNTLSPAREFCTRQKMKTQRSYKRIGQAGRPEKAVICQAAFASNLR
jgi:hypothetical protein